MEAFGRLKGYCSLLINKHLIFVLIAVLLIYARLLSIVRYIFICFYDDFHWQRGSGVQSRGRPGPKSTCTPSPSLPGVDRQNKNNRSSDQFLRPSGLRAPGTRSIILEVYSKKKCWAKNRSCCQFLGPLWCAPGATAPSARYCSAVRGFRAFAVAFCSHRCICCSLPLAISLSNALALSPALNLDIE